MAAIPILGVPSTYRDPGTFVQILFSQGPATAAAGRRFPLFIMPMLSTGSWTAGIVHQVDNESQAEAGGGAGSAIHRACRRFLKSNTNSKLYALPYAETSAGAPIQADLDITWTTDPTASGVTTLWIAGEGNTVGFDSTMSVTDITDAMILVVNAKTWLPVTATNAVGVLTLAAKHAGVSQGDGTTGAIRVHAEIDLGVTTTVATENGGTTDALGLGTSTAGVDGTTTDTANLTAALATIEASRYYYKAISSWDSTGLGALSLHVATVSQPIPGLRCIGLAAFEGALAAGIVLSNALNNERVDIVWQPNGEDDPASLVANLTAVRQKQEELQSEYNFDSYTETDWLTPSAWAEADWPDGDDRNDAINDGLTPIGSQASGSYIVYSATTRSKDSSGSVDDPRALETHRVSVMDEILDTWQLRHTLTYGKKQLKDDERLADGSVNFDQEVFANVVTPEAYKPFVRDIIDEFAVKLRDTAAQKAGLRVVIDPNNGGRLEIGNDFKVVNQLHQTTFRAAEISTG